MTEVHPAAAIFPMLPDDELDELAESIKAIGLLEPIVLDHDGQLIDGRNRLEACRRAGIEPTYTTLNGTDPVEYILSKNVNRRHMTKGQRAITIVLANSEKFIEWGAKARVAKEHGLDAIYIRHASTITDYCPHLIDAVLSGSEPFDRAYAEAHKRKLEEERDEERIARDVRALEMLREHALDLALLVEERRISITDAVAAWKEREEKERERRKEISGRFVQTAAMLDAMLISDPGRIVREWVSGIYGADSQSARDVKTSTGLRVLARRVSDLADVLESEGGELA